MWRCDCLTTHREPHRANVDVGRALFVNHHLDTVTESIEERMRVRLTTATNDRKLDSGLARKCRTTLGLFTKFRPP